MSGATSCLDRGIGDIGKATGQVAIHEDLEIRARECEIRASTSAQRF